MPGHSLWYEAVSALPVGMPLHLGHRPRTPAVQKMEGLLARWALAIQENDFQIVYWKSQHNGNADALSRKAPDPRCITATTVALPGTTADIQQGQR